MFSKIFSQSLAISLCQWIIIKTLVISNGLEFTGFYFLALSVTAPLFMLFGANFKNYATNPDFGSWDNLISRRLISLILAFVASLLVLLFIDSPFLVLILVITLKSVEFSIDSVQAYEIRFKKIKYIVVFSGLYFCLIFSIYTSQVIDFLEFEKAIFLLIIGCMLIILMAFARCDLFKVKKSIRSKWHENSYILKNIGMPACILSLSAMIPRLSIELYLDTVLLGVFGSLIYFYLIGHVFIIAMFQANIANFDAVAKKMLFVLNRLSLIFLILSVIGLVVSILYGDLILKLIFSEQLIKYSYLLPWFIGFIVVGCISTLYEQALINIDENIFIAKLNSYLLVFAIILCPILIKILSFNGVVLYMYIFNSTKLIFVYAKLKNVLTERQSDYCRS